MLQPKPKVKTYSIRELTGEARERAIAHWRHKWADEPYQLDGWEDKCIEELRERGMILGEVRRALTHGKMIGQPKFYYDLGYSQSDSVAFYGEIDPTTWLRFIRDATPQKQGCAAHPRAERQRAKELLRRLRILTDKYAPPIWVKVPHASHRHSMECEWTAEVSDGYIPELMYELAADAAEILWNDILAFTEETVRALAKRFQQESYEEFEYLNSEEAITEAAEANDARFDEEGAEVR